MNAHTLTQSIGNHLLAAMGAALILFSASADSLAATSVMNLGLMGDGQNDDTAALQRALASGQLDIEAVPALPGETQRAVLPAISNLSGHKVQMLMFVEGNTIQGWEQGIAIGAPARENDLFRLVIRNNSLDGTIRITGLPQSYRSVVTDNPDLKTLVPIQPVIEAQEPAGK